MDWTGIINEEYMRLGGRHGDETRLAEIVNTSQPNVNKWRNGTEVKFYEERPGILLKRSRYAHFRMAAAFRRFVFFLRLTRFCLFLLLNCAVFVARFDRLFQAEHLFNFLPIDTEYSGEFSACRRLRGRAGFSPRVNSFLMNSGLFHQFFSRESIKK